MGSLSAWQRGKLGKMKRDWMKWVGLLLGLGIAAGCGSTSQSATTAAHEGSSSADSNPVAEESEPEESSEEWANATTQSDSTDETEDSREPANGPIQREATEMESTECGAGDCEPGATCMTDERRCRCVSHCSGAYMPDREGTYVWECQDRRCPNITEVQSSPCTNERGSRRDACRTAIPCRHVGLRCGTGRCGGVALSCVDGRWEYRTFDPPPSFAR